MPRIPVFGPDVGASSWPERLERSVEAGAEVGADDLAGTVGEAFDDIYTLERACQILVQAYATGQPLKVLPDDVAETTAQDWEQITDFSIAHFEEMKRILDAEDPSYVS